MLPKQEQVPEREASTDCLAYASSSTLGLKTPFLDKKLCFQTYPSQGGQYCGITPLEEGVAPARGPTICEARLYAVPLPPWHRPVAPQYVRPHFMRCRSPLQITLL